MVRQSTKSFWGLTIRESPSVPTLSSKYSMPFEAAASFSAYLMLLEASEISVSPAVNRLKPPPVPEMPTIGWVLPWSFWNSSATACEIGETVLEPSISITPLSSGVIPSGVVGVACEGVSSGLHAADTTIAKARRVRTHRYLGQCEIAI